METRHLFHALVLLLLLLSARVGAAQEVHQKLYVLNEKADDMTVIDVATNRIIGSVKVGPGPHGIAAPRSQDVLYVSTMGDLGLTVVDPVKDEVVKQYHIFGKVPNEIEVTSDGRYVYVPASREGVYEVDDTGKEKIIARIPTDGFPHNVVVSPDDKYMYLSPAGKENEKIYIVATSTHSVVATIPTGNTPRPIALSPDGKRLYVNTNDLLGFVVLDLTRRKILSRAAYDLTPEERAQPSRSHGIGVTPDGREVWSTDVNHGLVHVFDVTSDPPRQIARLETGRRPLWLTFTPDRKTVYIANTADDTISAFDVASKKETARIQLERGKAPKRMLVVTVPGP